MSDTDNDQLVPARTKNGDMKRTGIGNAHREQLVDHVANNLDAVIASLIADGVSRKKAAACERRGCSHARVILFQVR